MALSYVVTDLIQAELLLQSLTYKTRHCHFIEVVRRCKLNHLLTSYVDVKVTNMKKMIKCHQLL